MMNYIKNLSDVIREYTGIFIIFFLVSALTIFSFLVLNLYNFQTLKNGQNISTESRTYEITGDFAANTNIEETINNIKDMKSNNSVERIILLPESTLNYQDIPMNIGILFDGDISSQISIDCGSNNIHINEANVILSTEFYRNNQLQLNIDDEISIDKAKLKVMGIGFIGEGEFDAITTKTAYEEIKCGIHKVMITFEERLDKKELRMMQDDLGDGQEITSPPLIVNSYLGEFQSRFLLIFCLILIATINSIGLYRYIIIRRKKEFIIYKIYGINKRQLKNMILTELFILFLISFLLGSSLYLLVYVIILQNPIGMIMCFSFLQTLFSQMICFAVAFLSIMRSVCNKSIVGEYSLEEVR